MTGVQTCALPIWVSPIAIRSNLHWVIKQYTADKVTIDDDALLLNEINENDIKQFSKHGWRLPSVEELKDLFAHNLSDYPIDAYKCSLDNNQDERIYAALDKNNKFVLYNDDTKSIIQKGNNKNTESPKGLCLLIKKINK